MQTKRRRSPILIAAVSTTILTLLSGCAAVAQAHVASTPPGSTSMAPVFDVASIRPNISSTDGHSHIYSSPSDGEFRTINVSLKTLISVAYDLPETQILDAPRWIGSEKFDIVAKSSEAMNEQFAKLDSDHAREIKRQMLQALLEDRFHLEVHHETRDLPLYALLVAKGGSKLVKFEANGTTINVRRNQIVVQGGHEDTVGVLAAELAKLLGRVVLNQTGIQGRYDIKLSWQPEPSAAAAAAADPRAAPSASDPAGPSIFTAIQEQLGLKLESRKGPVPVLIVDSVDQPTQN